MRISGNKLIHLRDFFYSELKGIYERSEINAMFEVAVEKILGLSKVELLKQLDTNLNQSDLLKLYDCAKDLKKQIPLQYILKEAWFYDLKFYVDTSVLIPRPETEELVDLILKENKTLGSLLDLGTGSGCIPITIKSKINTANVSACDISDAALSVAKKNALNNNVSINFIKADILNLKPELPAELDVIVSNPPYIKDSEKNTMSANVLDHEPHLALFVEGEDATIFYKKIVDLCATHLNKNGKLYFELNPLTSEIVKNYADRSGIFYKTTLLKDMSGAVRFLKAEKKN